MQKVKSIRNGKKSIQNGKKYVRNVYKDANMYANVSNCVRNNFSRYAKCWYAKRHKAKCHQASWLVSVKQCLYAIILSFLVILAIAIDLGPFS